MELLNITNLKIRLNKFAKDREWGQFHSPKNLVMALSVEASELLEHFQWMKEEDSIALKESGDTDKIEAIGEEIADVLLYTIRLADMLGVDVTKALDDKIEKNALKYPADKCRGTSKKYDEL